MTREELLEEIDRNRKWLCDAGYTAYNIDVAFASIYRKVKELEKETSEDAPRWIPDDAQENTKEVFIVVLDTDDENEYNNPPQFSFKTYKEMDDFLQFALLHDNKDDLKIIITKGYN